MAETVALGIGMFFVSLPREVQLPTPLSLALQLRLSVLQRTGDDKARRRENNHSRLEGRALPWQKRSAVFWFLLPGLPLRVSYSVKYVIALFC